MLLRFCDDAWTPSFITTIGIDFKIRTIELDGKRIKLQIVRFSKRCARRGTLTGHVYFPPVVVGYCRARTFPNYHYCVLSGRDGYPTCLRCHRRAVLQQYVLRPLIRHSPEPTLLLLCFVDIRTWHSNIEQHASEGVNKILIGNKNDWTEKRAVTEEQGRELADELGIKFLETSAKVNEGVEDAFFKLARCRCFSIF